MRALSRAVLPLLLGLAACAGGAEPRAHVPPERPTGRVTILHLGDSHGRYQAFEVGPGNATAQTGDPGGPPIEFSRAGRVGGFPALGAAITAIRRARGPQNVVLVHTGDAFSDDLLGNLTRGEAVIRLMNELGFALMALGNHDFDYGLRQTRRLAARANFPFLAANVLDRASGAPAFGDPTRVVEAGGLKVGLLALGYHNTGLTANPRNVRGLAFSSGIEAARAYVPDLRRRADLVVVVSHQGAAVDEVLAREVAGIDLIVGGHSHDLGEKKVGDTIIVHTLSNTAVLGETTITVREGEVTGIVARQHTLWADEHGVDLGLLALVGELRAPHRARLEEVLTTAVDVIGRNYMSESPFDRLVGDILREHTGAEVAFLPGVGYGVSLRPGPVTREALYTLLPHPAKVVTLRLSGRLLRAALEQSATNIEPPDPLAIVGGLAQTSGATWTVDLTRPPGDRIRDVEVGGAPLEPGRRYRIVTHSGVLRGLHRYDMFANGDDITRHDLRVVELVEQDLRGRVRLEAPPGGAVTLVRPPPGERD